jgi:molybdate transport system substrate-binding protein
MFTFNRVTSALTLSCLLLVALGTTGVRADTLRVAVAANFKPTLLAIAPVFETRSEHQLRISSASTGMLFNQILHGAPFDVLLAADAERPALLEERQLAVTGSRFTYATGQLVLVYRPPLASLAQRGPAALLLSPRLSLVIANPELAPYGEAAAQVLQHLNAPAVNGRLLRATNVSQAFQMWHSGGADAALVSRSQVSSHFLTIPDEWYSAPRQQAVLLQRAAGSQAARDFLEFLRQPATRELIRAQGYGTIEHG